MAARPRALTRLTHRGAAATAARAADGRCLTAIRGRWSGPICHPRSPMPPVAPPACASCPTITARHIVTEALEDEGWEDVAWREVPVGLGVRRRARVGATNSQLFALHQSPGVADRAAGAVSVRRGCGGAAGRAKCHGASIVSLSLRDGLPGARRASDLQPFYPDPRIPASRRSVFHQRLAPTRFRNGRWRAVRSLAHNGEISDSRNQLKARRRRAVDARCRASVDAGAIVRLRVIRRPRRHGRAVAASGFQPGARLLPPLLPRLGATRRSRRASCCSGAYQAGCEPWEGPAAIAFADGAGRRGCRRSRFRPARVSSRRTASSRGVRRVFDIPERSVKRRGRLGRAKCW
jgi:glutamate synthase domain-containing protein 1